MDTIAYRVSQNKYALDKLASSPLHSENISETHSNTYIHAGLDISRQSFDRKQEIQYLSVIVVLFTIRIAYGWGIQR